jgi:hypothetical protein
VRIYLQSLTQARASLLLAVREEIFQMAIFKRKNEEDIKGKVAPNESPEYQDAQGPTHDEIALMAYGIFLDRGGAEGGESEDWFEAEKRLLSERAQNRVPKSKSTAA